MVGLLFHFRPREILTPSRVFHLPRLEKPGFRTLQELVTRVAKTA